jgi:hypothetical protein
MLRDAGVVTFLDVDDTVEATHGYTKQGAGYGYSGVKGLNALIATVSTPEVRAPDRGDQAGQGVRELGPRRGPADRRRAGHHLAVRRDRAGDSARRQRLLQPRRGRRGPPRRGERLDHRRDEPGLCCGRSRPSRSRRGPQGQYPNAIWDEDEQRLVSDAQVAEIPNTRVHRTPPQ